MRQTLQNRIDRRSWPRAASRWAYTLTELMIVLGIILAIVSVSWPALMRPWSRNQSQQAAQRFAEHLQEARIRAIEDSRVYRLRWRPGRSDYQIDAPFAATGVEQGPADRISPTTAESSEPNLPSTASPADIAPDDEPNQLGSSAVPNPDDLLTAKRPQPFHVSDTLENGVRFHDQLAVSGALQSADLTELEPTPSERTGAYRESVAGAPIAADETAQDTAIDDGSWSEPIWFYPDGRTSNVRWTLDSDEGYQVDVRLRGLTGTVRVEPARRIPPSELEALPTSDNMSEPNPAGSDPAIPTMDRSLAPG